MAMEIKRKTPSQLEALEDFYSVEKYPTKIAMEDFTVSLGLTYKQVRGWFIERRRRDKKENGASASNKKLPSQTGINGVALIGKKVAKKQSVIHGGKFKSSYTKLRHKRFLELNATQKGQSKKKCTERNTSQPFLMQDLLLTPDYILKKVFRKDGPPLGVEFDCLPSRAFFHSKDSSKLSHASPEKQRAPKRRKVSNTAHLDIHDGIKKCASAKKHGIGKGFMTKLAPVEKHGIGKGFMKKSVPVKKHGIGKGLMTAWRVTNPGAGDFPTGVDLTDKEITASQPNIVSLPKKLASKKVQQKRPMKEKKSKNKLLEKKKKKTCVKRKGVAGKKHLNQNQPYKEICDLALVGALPQELLEQFAMLVDDEELELRELQAGPNPLTCTSHFSGTGTGMHSCSLCKDLLPKFPPNSVKMKLPFSKQPWVSSPEAVKKLFKALHFLYTYAILINISSFTFDEFVQAFHEKDSLLLGEVHIALLKLLLSDVETEFGKGFFSYQSKSCKFLELLHSIEHNQYLLKFWIKSLNPLTWTEILRQVLVASGSGFKNGASQREILNKKAACILKYGLYPGTLKGELFNVLSEQGNNGMKISELVKSIQIVELDLPSTTNELEQLICSTLSSDITLFEKISSSTYRLRISFDESDNIESDSDDSGSVDNNSRGSDTCSESDESDCTSGISFLRKCMQVNKCKRRNALTVCTEIDESRPGEVWLLGLAEGEYSDLKIEEKLNALVALVDLISAGSSIRMEDPVLECRPMNRPYGSGAKIKRSSVSQHNLIGPPSSRALQMHSANTTFASSESLPIDSSVTISKFCPTARKEGEGNLHPMQSIFLGSDRRYNRYWLFLGPCIADDPGHKRIYFESSEDGHWEVLESEEALHALLSILDVRGKREARLITSLEKRKSFLLQEIFNRTLHDYGLVLGSTTLSGQSELDREDSSSPVSNVDNNLCTNEISKAQSCGITIEVGRKAEQQHEQNWSRLQAFDAWIWHSFYMNLYAVKHSKRSYLDSLARCESCHDLFWRDEKHCKICHATFELDFDLEERYAIHVATCRENEDVNNITTQKVLSSQLQTLKAAIHVVESVMPEGSLVGAWTKCAHKIWIKRLRRTSSLAELLQVLTDFVGAINEEWLFQCSVKLSSNNNTFEEIITGFQTLPQTYSAVALWLVKLDAVIDPYLEKVSSEKHDEIGKKSKGSKEINNLLKSRTRSQ